MEKAKDELEENATPDPQLNRRRFSTLLSIFFILSLFGLFSPFSFLVCCVM